MRDHFRVDPRLLSAARPLKWVSGHCLAVWLQGVVFGAQQTAALSTESLKNSSCCVCPELNRRQIWQETHRWSIVKHSAVIQTNISLPRQRADRRVNTGPSFARWSETHPWIITTLHICFISVVPAKHSDELLSIYGNVIPQEMDWESVWIKQWSARQALKHHVAWAETPDEPSRNFSERSRVTGGRQLPELGVTDGLTQTVVPRWGHHRVAITLSTPPNPRGLMLLIASQFLLLATNTHSLHSPLAAQLPTSLSALTLSQPFDLHCWPGSLIK